jgi:hypothetical protein
MSAYASSKRAALGVSLLDEAPAAAMLQIGSMPAELTRKSMTLLAAE